MATIQSESSESYPDRLGAADVFFRGEPDEDEEEDEEEDRRKDKDDDDDDDESDGYSE
ncbi:MAG: hypothetical protein WA172_06655 [Terriglobales bacterium]